jgi:hypothetical protein
MVKFLKYDMQMPNPYPENSIWIGDRYDDPDNELRGALILGVATWGSRLARTPSGSGTSSRRKPTRRRTSTVALADCTGS